MSTMLSRREMFGVLAALGLMPNLTVAEALAAEASTRLGPAQGFSFSKLMAAAKDRASKPFVPETPRAADTLEAIDYDKHWQIKFKPDHTVQAAGGKAPLRFFHLGRYFKLPVGIYLVNGEKAQEVLYSPDYFDIPMDNPAAGLPGDIGFAGFRVMVPGEERDWLAFLGAAYFRSSGALDQYGLSARAICIDVAMPTPEEFPRFTNFYFGPSKDGLFTIYADLEGPRVSGAVRWDMSRGGDATGKQVVMDMAVRFYPRADIARLGVGTLTSMFWYDETNRQKAPDWRPEIHDSDGLAIWTGSGERLWRPLNNPPNVMTSTFVDNNVKGFGLCQRDRHFENYQDDGVFYEKRSTVWVEPSSAWGEGAVQLVEIPTDDEIHDNIVAYWVPKKPATQGSEIGFDYRLTWGVDEPHVPPVGRVYSTRLGFGGVPGQVRPVGTVKYVVDFDGGELAKYGQKDGVEAVVSSSAGTISGVYVLPVVGTTRWRAVFDFKPAGKDPVDMRLYLKAGDKTLTETWLYQHHNETFVWPK
jgi:glucans biosynthesis protein